jgi:hypothetical protein
MQNETHRRTIVNLVDQLPYQSSAGGIPTDSRFTSPLSNITDSIFTVVE